MYFSISLRLVQIFSFDSPPLGPSYTLLEGTLAYTNKVRLREHRIVRRGLGEQSLYSKQRKGGSRLNELTLFIYIHKHSFGGLEADTLTFCGSTPLYPFPGFSEHSLVVAISIKS